MSVMFLDIATIPDFQLGTRLYDLHDLSDKDVSRVMATKTRETGNDADVLPRHMQRVLAVSVLYQDKDHIKIWSIGDAGSDEADLLKILHEYALEHEPAVVSWNGDRTIFPVLNYRFMTNCIRLPLFTNKTNLMTELAGMDGNDDVALHEVAVLAGSTGNVKMTGDEVLDNYLQADIEPVRHNLELSLIDNWLIYQNWQLINEKIDQISYETEKKLLIKMLQQDERKYLTEIANAIK